MQTTIKRKHHCCSAVQPYPTLHNPCMDCSTPGFPILHHLLELAQTYAHWVSDAIQPFHSLLSPSPPAFNLSSIRVFSHESALFTRWPKFCSFSFSISPSNEYSRFISFRIDWFNLLAVQGTHKFLLQHDGSKASILQCSAFFMIQFSHSYMTTGKTIALIKWTFVSKVMSLFFGMLSRLVIAFLPRNKCWVMHRQKGCHCSLSPHTLAPASPGKQEGILPRPAPSCLQPLKSHISHPY